jgi:hypothetical protein
MPRDRTRKSTLVAVKVDAELAALLDAMPNKSEFIRMALRSRLDDLCPLCAGTGLRPSQPLEHRAGRHLHALPRARCGDCGRESPVVADVDPGQADRVGLLREVSRLRTFLAYGDYFCPACYARSTSCDRCGHRIAGAGPAREAHGCGA